MKSLQLNLKMILQSTWWRLCACGRKNGRRFSVQLSSPKRSEMKTLQLFFTMTRHFVSKKCSGLFNRTNFNKQMHFVFYNQGFISYKVIFLLLKLGNFVFMNSYWSKNKMSLYCVPGWTSLCGCTNRRRAFRCAARRSREGREPR